MSGGIEHLAGDDARLEDGDALVEVVLVPGVLLDGVERPAVGAGETEPLLGTLDRPEETAVPVIPHHAGPGDLLAAHRPEGAVDQQIELHLGPQQLLGHHQSVLEVGAPALRAGQEGAANCPAAGADDVRTLAAVERGLGGGGAADDTHQEGGGETGGMSHGAVVLPQHHVSLHPITSLGVSLGRSSAGAGRAEVVVTVRGVLRETLKDLSNMARSYSSRGTPGVFRGRAVDKASLDGPGVSPVSAEVVAHFN